MTEEHGSQDSQANKERNSDPSSGTPTPELPDDSRRQTGTTEGTTKPEQANDDIKPFEKRMFWLTATGIFLAAITATIFWGQFKEMISQTDMLSISARQARRDSENGDLRAQQQISELQRQATAAQDGVRIAAKESAQNAVRIERQLKLLQSQAEANRDQADAALKSAIAIQKQTEISERPWLSVNLKLSIKTKSISKFTIAREILERLNAKKDNHLRELREVVRRVTEFEDFSTCWPGDQLKAKGLIAEVRRVVDVKDAFTRMRMERETEANRVKAATGLKIRAVQQRKEKIQAISQDFFALFSEADAHKRGKALEGVLNRVFAAYDMLVRESFTVKGAWGEGVIEQIDGVVEIDGDLFLVEMKWWNKPLGTNEISPHLVRVYGRGAQAKGIFISYTDYTDAAIDTCRQALAGGALVALCKLQELVMILDKYDQGADLKTMLRAKVHAALLDKKPWHEFLG